MGWAARARAETGSWSPKDRDRGWRRSRAPPRYHIRLLVPPGRLVNCQGAVTSSEYSRTVPYLPVLV